MISPREARRIRPPRRRRRDPQPRPTTRKKWELPLWVGLALGAIGLLVAQVTPNEAERNRDQARRLKETVTNELIREYSQSDPGLIRFIIDENHEEVLADSFVKTNRRRRIPSVSYYDTEKYRESMWWIVTAELTYGSYSREEYYGRKEGRRRGDGWRRGDR